MRKLYGMVLARIKRLVINEITKKLQYFQRNQCETRSQEQIRKSKQHHSLWCFKLYEWEKKTGRGTWVLIVRALRTQWQMAKIKEVFQGWWGGRFQFSYRQDTRLVGVHKRSCSQIWISKYVRNNQLFLMRDCLGNWVWPSGNKSFWGTSNRLVESLRSGWWIQCINTVCDTVRVSSDGYSFPKTK